MMDILLTPLLISMGLNLLMFIPAYLLKTDKLTDISYSITFIGLAGWAYANGEQSTYHLIALILIFLWAIRLGGYLFYRIHHIGRDQRFDEMRNSVPRFLGFWTLQGLTVFMVSIPFLLFAKAQVFTLHPVGFAGVGIFLIGLLIESVADWQKFKFKMAGNTSWVNVGLWKKIRHPNYLGEMMVWIGVYFFVAGNLPLIHALISLISPLFIIILLRFVSGIPLLEKSQNARWGENPAFRKYLESSNRLLPF